MPDKQKNLISKLLSSQKKPLLLDGALGTELQRRGVDTTLPLWSAGALITHPDEIRKIHLDYINAGSDIITTNTFRTNYRAIKKAGISQTARELTLLACKLATEAKISTGKVDTIIAGCIAPLEECYSPELVPSNKELYEEHLLLIKDLSDGSVDFILAETMNTVREAYHVAKAAKDNGLEVAVSFVCNREGRLLSGETLEEAITVISEFEPVFIGTNCATPGVIKKSAELISKTPHIPACVYANGIGRPGNPYGWEFGNIGTESDEYLKHVKDWISAGAKIIGGCCGTTPEYIAYIRKELRENQPEFGIKNA